MNNGERGGQSQKDLPLFIAGGKAWGYKHGQHLAHDPEKNPPLSICSSPPSRKWASKPGKFQVASVTLNRLV